MPKVTLTTRWVASVKPPPTGRIDYFDTKQPGIGLRVASSGHKTWFIMYRSGRRLRRLTLGPYPAISLADARNQALDARHAVAKGEDPAVHKRASRGAPLLAEVAEQYIEKYARVHKKSWRDDARLLQKEVIPHWGKRKARDIARRDVLALLDGIVERGAPIQANRVLALVRKLFNWAISRDLLEYNPCYQVKAPSKERQRDRVLNDEEIRLVWEACAILGPMLETYFKIRLLTAQRRDEIRTMHWDDVDLESKWWTIPASQAKNGLAHRVPLSNTACDLLRRLQTTSGSKTWMFPSPRRQGQPVVNVRKPALRVRAHSEIDFIPHDLRRTAASHMTSMGISRLVVAKILNHMESGITRVYDRHSYDGEKRQALDAWDQKVMGLVTGKPGKVVPIHRKIVD